MAAITPTAASMTGEQVGAFNLQGARLRRFPFASIADADTWASGINGIVEYGIFSSSKAIFGSLSGSTFTFTVTSGPAADAIVYVWALDY